MHRQRDSFGLIAFDDSISALLPASARSGHLRAVLLALERLQMGTRTNVAKPLHDLAAAVRKRGMVVLVSDLLDDPATVLDGLKHFRYRGTDVIVFHILDPYELKFPFEQAARFRDMETAGRGDGGAGIGARGLPRAHAGPDRVLPARARASPASTIASSKRRSRSSSG